MVSLGFELEAGEGWVVLWGGDGLVHGVVGALDGLGWVAVGALHGVAGSWALVLVVAVVVVGVIVGGIH